jgi:hypothetical protein
LRRHHAILPTLCAKPLLCQEGALPNNSGIAKDIADLCWVMAIGDGRPPILEELVPSGG